MKPLFLLLTHTTLLLIHRTSTEPTTDPSQPLKPGDYTVPSFPVQTSSPPSTCHLDLSNELFGGVDAACGHTSTLDRGRCCPVLAAWLFAAHARSALLVSAPTPSPSAADGAEMPMIPDDSRWCVDSLQSSLLERNIRIPQPNASCDAVLCFCGIRLHEMASLSCPAAFDVAPTGRNATPTAVVRGLEKSCRNASYSGCTKCLGALHKLKADNTTTTTKNGSSTWTTMDGRGRKMLNWDCQLMGLTWLLARNKTAYIPTVSAVLRAMMYSDHGHSTTNCTPDHDNMPLAVDSLQFDSSATSPLISFPFLPLTFALYYTMFN